MTRVVFYKSDDVFYGFDITGHTGLAEAGEDILCAAISSMTIFVINTVEQTYHAPVTYTVDDKEAHISFYSSGAFRVNGDEKVAFAVAGLIVAYYEQLKELETEYPEYLRVTAAEKQWSKH